MEIIKKHSQSLFFWVSEKDDGQSAAINRGLRMAVGEIVGWLNSDDTLAPGALHRIGRYYACHPETNLLYGHTCMIDEHDRVIRRLLAVPTTAYELIHFNRNSFSQPGTTWRRCLHEKVGYLDETLHFLMDNDFWIRAATVTSLDFLPVHLGNLRQHPATKSQIGRVENLATQMELSRRYGTEFAFGPRRIYFQMCRLTRIARNPASWLYRLGLT